MSGFWRTGGGGLFIGVVRGVGMGEGGKGKRVGRYVALGPLMAGGGMWGEWLGF